MALTGKGFFLWKIPSCEKGDPESIAQAAEDAGLSHVLIKIANSTKTYNYIEEDDKDLVPSVVVALRKRGIQSWGWQYVYGDLPVQEAKQAVNRVIGLGLDGFVVNAEIEYKESRKEKAAVKYMEKIRASLPNLPIALSTFRYPTYHPSFPYEEFLTYCDYTMPQVYWMGGRNPGSQLHRSFKEYQAIVPSREMIPTGYAFAEHGFDPPSEVEVEEFMNTARMLKMPGINFWSWDYCRLKLPKIWQKISQFEWPFEVIHRNFGQKYIDLLNNHDPIKMTMLYDPMAAHVNSSRTVQGYSLIQEWYTQLFSKILPIAIFQLTGYSENDNTHHIHWSSFSSSGNVLNGNDTIILKDDGKIGYHFTYFSKS